MTGKIDAFDASTRPCAPAAATSPADEAALRAALAAANARIAELEAQVAAGAARLAHVRASRQLLRSVLDNSDVSVCVSDRERRVEWVNRGFTRRTGWRLDEVVGRRPEDFLYGAGSDADALHRIAACCAEGRDDDVELLHYRRDGSTYWAAVELRAIRDRHGRHRHVAAIAVDISGHRDERTRSHAESAMARGLAEELRLEKSLLESVVSTLPHAICWTDRTFRVIGCNDTFAAHLGSDGGEPRGAPMAALLSMYFRRDGAMYERTVVREGRPLRDVEHAFRRPDGGEGVMLSSAVPLRGDRGVVTGMLWTAVDVTELRSLERELGHARHMEAIGQLAAGVAHEINTPSQYVSDNIAFVNDAFSATRPVMLALRAHLEAARDDGSLDALRMAADTADLDYLVEETPLAIAQARDGLAHIKKIVHAMKEFSHPGQQRKEPMDLNRLVRNVVIVARNEWKYVAEVMLDLDDTLPFVSAIASGINQVVLNLVVNAGHALADRKDLPDKGAITLRTRRDGEHAVLEVVDNGCGIPANVMPRIFDLFFTTKEVGRGTGQGLAIARSVVHDAHGGTITVSSTPGTGSCFTVRLPIGDGHAAPAAGGEP